LAVYLAPRSALSTFNRHERDQFPFFVLKAGFILLEGHELLLREFFPFRQGRHHSPPRVAVYKRIIGYPPGRLAARQPTHFTTPPAVSAPPAGPPPPDEPPPEPGCRRPARSAGPAGRRTAGRRRRCALRPGGGAGRTRGRRG